MQGGRAYEKSLHNAPTFFLNVSNEAEQELVTEQIKSIVSCYRAPTAKSDEEETKLN